MLTSKNRYAKLVNEAYSVPHGVAHRRIIRKFRAWMGTDISPFWLRPSKKFQHYVRKAARAIAEDASNPDLGFHSIGFKNLKIRCFKTDTTSASVYLFGMSDNYPIFNIYERYIRPGSTAVDIGANLGMHAMVMAALCGDEGNVYAFEPSKSIFNRLQENIQENQLRNITALNKAVGNEDGEVGFDDNSSSTNIGTSCVDHLQSTKVPICKLDDELPAKYKISLIKIDVEGFELDVLKGAANILSTHQPIVVLEFNPEDYKLTELIKSMPYPVHMRVIRYQLYGKSEPVVKHNRILRDLNRQRNLLIIPAEKDMSDPIRRNHST